MKNRATPPFASAAAGFEDRIRQRKQPVQRRSEVTIDALLEATIQVLLRDGYKKLTTTKVAARAGASVGTLYQYFPDKQSLVTALKARYFGSMITAMKDSLAQPNDDPELLIQKAISALIAVKRENLEFSKALRGAFEESWARDFVIQSLDQFALVLETPLRRCFPDATDLPDHVRFLVAAIEGAISQAVWTKPEWLAEPWFPESLTAMAAGYLRVIRAA